MFYFKFLLKGLGQAVNLLLGVGLFVWGVVFYFARAAFSFLRFGLDRLCWLLT